MSFSRKVIKMFSILTAFEGIILAVFTVLWLLGIINLDPSDAAFVSMHTKGNTMYAAIAMLIVAAFELVEGFLGVRGANVPSKMLPFIVCAAASLSYYCTEFLHSLLEGTLSFAMGGNFVVAVIVLYISYRDFKQSLV